MKYFFVLGNNPTLSAAEIAAVIKSDSQGKLLAGQVLVWEMPATDAKQLIARLGGTIKIGVIMTEVNRHDNEKIKAEILKIIEESLTESSQGGKYCFGLSYYGASKIPVFPIGLAIKKILKEKKISCRLVTSKEKVLSSVVVEQNKLTSRGIEIVLIEEAGTLYLGYTEAVQPFKELSFRDFGRPERDDESGMIPPKLAQIMINLAVCHREEEPQATTKPAYRTGRQSRDCFASAASAHNDLVMLDPFCGSGTILMEAALMGVKNLIGADISPKAIAATEKNFQWLKNNYELSIINYKLLASAAAEISQKIPINSVDVIVTEPYLGPQRGKHDIQKTIIELEKLYSASLKEFAKVLKPNGRVVMVWPVFTGRGSHQWDFLNPALGNLQIQNPLPENLRGKLSTTRRGTIIYGRPGQKVYREIVVLGTDILHSGQRLVRR